MKSVITYSLAPIRERKLKYSALNEQEETHKAYCNKMDYEIILSLSEFGINRNDKREKYIELKKAILGKRPGLILITSWDKLTHYCEDCWKLIEYAKSFGVEIRAIHQPIDFTNPDWKAKLAYYVMTPGSQRQRAAEKVLDRIKKEPETLNKWEEGNPQGTLF